MEKAALYHRAESEYAYLYTANEIHIRFRSKKDDVDQVWLHYGDSHAIDQYHGELFFLSH